MRMPLVGILRADEVELVVLGDEESRVLKMNLGLDHGINRPSLTFSVKIWMFSLESPKICSGLTLKLLPTS